MFNLPPIVHQFSTKKPETIRLEDRQIAIHGQDFADRVETDDLSQYYPKPVIGWLRIGMLRTSCGHYETHDPSDYDTVCPTLGT